MNKPYSSQPKPGRVPRWFGWSAVLTLTVLLLGAGFWWFYQSPQALATEALQKLQGGQQLRLNGTLAFSHINAQPASTTPSFSGVEFQAVQQNNRRHVLGTAQIVHGQQTTPITAEFIETEGASFIKLADTSFFTPLIAAAAPLKAAQLIETSAYYEQNVGKSWLWLQGSHPDTDLLDFVPQTKMQRCTVALLHPDTTKALLGKFAANPAVKMANESAETAHLQLALLGDALNSLPPVPAISECQLGSGDKLLLDLHLHKIERTVREIQLVIISGEQRLALNVDVASQLPETKPIETPATSISLQQLSRSSPKVEAAITQRLAEFPHLATIIENLRRFELKQGGFNP